MELDDQFRRYFGTRHLATLNPPVPRLLHMLGTVLDLDVAFISEADRAAALRFKETAGSANYRR